MNSETEKQILILKAEIKSLRAEIEHLRGIVGEEDMDSIDRVLENIDR